MPSFSTPSTFDTMCCTCEYFSITMRSVTLTLPVWAMRPMSLRATFPAGTLTGAPKVRAMEVIDELEPVKRGIYGGACGYLSFGGEMDVAIAIRTGVIKDGNLYVQAAAGIVADSIPEMEWQETENKARAVLRAAEQVQDGLDGAN